MPSDEFHDGPLQPGPESYCDFHRFRLPRAEKILATAFLLLAALLAVGSVAAAPANDDFSNSILISGLTGTTTGSNVGATKETGEPNHYSAGGKSVWWQWTAPASGTAVIDTDGSDFDTLLAIYTGGAVNSLTLIDSDDDSGSGLDSQVTFTAIGGTTYQIAVDGYSADSGNLQLNWNLASSAPDIRITPLDLSFTITNSVPAPVPAKPAPSPGRLVGMTASPHSFREVQPDGTPITLHIRGGVGFHWLEDTAGYTVVRDGAKYVYAQLDKAGGLTPTRLLVGEASPAVAGLVPRTLPQREVRQALRAERLATAPASAPSAAISPMGTVKNIVILMRFANHTNRTLPSPSDFNTIFNAVGGDPVLAPTGSVRDFYSENSYGVMTLDSTIYGWVTLPKTEQYYANGNSGLDSTIHEAITTALELADPLIDFSQFDADGDGYVDSIAFVHSGYGAEWGGTDADGVDSAGRIWSHRWQIPTWTSAEGVRVSDYHINPGLWGTSGTAPGRIGVICHETGHFFGLPDLYDTDDGGEGIGSYGLMANSWGFTGSQLNPPHFSAWSKIFLGWINPTMLDAPGNYTLPRAETSPTAYRINNGYPPGEYLLVENREPYGFESTMPQGGLVVWHIDENKSDNTEEGYPGQVGWPGNDNHYEVALLQADGLYNLEHGNNRGDAGDVYQSAGVSEINGSTTPNTDAYQHGTVIPTGNRLFAISSAGATMSFSYTTGDGLSNGFRIFNDGTADLTVNAITPDTGAPWLNWTPAAPFTLAPGAMQFVSLAVDSAQAPPGTTSTRLLVESDDPDESPYPGGVFVYLTNTAAPPPVADFAADFTNGLAPLTVNFTNLSTDATSFTWDFGDGQTSTDAEPSNTYSNAGSFTVSLTAVGDGGTNTLTLTDLIVVTNPPPPLPVADFTADFTNGLAPLTVNFTNRSTDATSFTWDFGDGHSSTDAEPSNTYSNAGTYSVSLTAVGDGGTNTLTLTDFIVVTNLPPPLPVADFVADFTNGLAPLTVNFTNRSTDATSFTWDFGDGHSSTDAEPSNTYSNAGSFTVSLTAVGDGGTNTLTLTDFIVVTNPPPPLPVADFVADFTNGLAPLTVNFTNRSTDATSFTWDFGDGHSSTDAEPSNTYSNAGTYSVSLTAVGDGGTNTLTLTDLIVVTNPPPPLPVADFTADFTNGLAPLTVNFTNRSTDATSFTWDFGDGHSSTDAEPSNTYSNAGTYSVSLTAVGDGGTNTLTLTDFIVVTNPPPPLPVANFVADFTDGLAPLTVNFTNRSTDATSFTWDFGDGHSSTDAEPSNTYSNAGTYSVSLTAVGDGGTNTLTLTDFIVVTNLPPPLPVADFVADFTNEPTGPPQPDHISPRLSIAIPARRVEPCNAPTAAATPPMPHSLSPGTSAMAIPAPTPSRRTLTATPALIPSR